MVDNDGLGDVTLGEVWRGLQEVKVIVKESFAELKSEMNTMVDAKTAGLRVRVDRLEKIVYGAIALLAMNLVAVIRIIMEVRR